MAKKRMQNTDLSVRSYREGEAVAQSTQIAWISMSMKMPSNTIGAK
jgi:hypothetical protein